ALGASRRRTVFEPVLEVGVHGGKDARVGYTDSCGAVRIRFPPRTFRLRVGPGRPEAHGRARAPEVPHPGTPEPEGLERTIVDLDIPQEGDVGAARRGPRARAHLSPRPAEVLLVCREPSPGGGEARVRADHEPAEQRRVGHLTLWARDDHGR